MGKSLKKEKKNKRDIISINPSTDVKLVHKFKDIIPDVDEFFKSDNECGVINTINALCYKIKLLSKNYSNSIREEDFKGWALELFSEYLVKTNSSDNRIGIYNYVPLFSDELDVGVDGRGVGENGNPATVQVKYRAGDYVLTANDDHLSNFLTASWFDEGVNIEDDSNMLIITTGQKVCEFTLTNMLKGKVRVLNREALREMLDNRPEWWIRFYESVKSSRLKREEIKPITLRDYQLESVELIVNNHNQKGKVILPTGTGKTLIEAEVIHRTIINVQNSGFVPVIKMNSPRILLCFQLFEEIFSYLNSVGITARYINYNSGNADDKRYIAELRKLGGAYREIASTTSCEEVVNVYRRCQEERTPLIVFSTYHSSEKFANSGIVPNLTIHDEAHNLVSGSFCKAAQLDSDANFFFTATEKVTDGENGLGMNNFNIFDETIYAKSPREMILKGEMLPPYIHVVKAKNNERVDLSKIENDYDTLLCSISDAFIAHQREIRRWSFCPAELGAKVLVVCRGQLDLIEMFKTKVFENFRKENPDVHVCALSSDFGLYLDGKYFKSPVDNIKKFNLIKTVKSYPSSAKLILFHVDMIGEGIDVPGITGVMPFRNCELSKFIQNTGRACRLHPTDRKRLYNGEISPGNRDNWIKPHSWVIVPSFLENSEGFYSRFREIVYTLRNDFGYIPRQHTVVDNNRGIDEDEEIDAVNKKVKIRPHSKSGIKGFIHEFEDMSEIEKIIFYDKVDEHKSNISDELDTLMSSI